LDADAVGVELPQLAAPIDTVPETQTETYVESAPEEELEPVEDQPAATTPKVAPSGPAVELPAPRSETPSTQDQPSEDTTSTTPSTPGSTLPPPSATGTITITVNKPVKSASRSAVPAVPVLPILPKVSPKEVKAADSVEKTPVDTKATPTNGQAKPKETVSKEVNGAVEGSAEAVQQTPAVVKPKSWANLFAKPAPLAGSTTSATATQAQTNGSAGTNGSGGDSGAVAGFAKANASSLADALKAYRAGEAEKLAFLKPRGLVNTGNMCYMNSAS
jgi:ubiquitin carboxyl-terminal hydrolase 10